MKGGLKEASSIGKEGEDNNFKCLETEAPVCLILKLEWGLLCARR